MQTTRARRGLLITCLFAGLPLGCGDAAPLDPGSTLRASFPEQAAQILAPARAFHPGESGFALAGADESGPSGLRLSLPSNADGRIHWQGGDGLDLAVRELGATGESGLVGGAVAYRGASGTSYWTTVPTGYEEWLLLEEGVARADRVAASWEVERGSLREDGDAVVVTDETGKDRLRVTAPVAYAASGLRVRAVLSAREGRIELRVDAGGERALVDPLWIAAGVLAARQGHTATLLPNGKVLVAGGSNVFTTTNLYDPAINGWSQAAPLNFKHEHGAATLLPNGKVLIAGDQGGNPKAAELYDPVANSWGNLPSMSVDRYDFTMTPLDSGKVLVVGGGFNGSNNVELYDPATGTWAPAAPLGTWRAAHTATRLPSGQVLVTGGYRAGSSVAQEKSCELYDPMTGTWTAAASMTHPRREHTATLLPSGKVLVTGGYSSQDGVWRDAELYNPVTNSWSAAGLMGEFRRGHTATRMPSGKVLIVGGSEVVFNLKTTELYDPVANTWKSAPSMIAEHAVHTATLLPNGKVLAVGPTPELYTSGSPGVACAVNNDCESGFCVDGVCCSSACAAGPCDACSVAAGAALDGTCALLTGPSCDDGNACTQVDTCEAGLCKGSANVVCPAPGPCKKTGVCAPATGVCSAPLPLGDGTACDDGNACTQTDTCKAGACVGASPVACPAKDTCHAAGACDPATGTCSAPLLPDGASCDDDDACTQTDACAAGVCIGSSPVQCQAMDDCHKVGVCNPGTGVCSQPKKANGSGCDDGNACTTKDQCQAGVCKGMAPVACVALDECHEAGTCAEATGTCSDPVKADGSACSGGACQGGVCVPVGGTTTTATTGAGAGGGTGTGGSDGSGGGGDSSETCGCETVGSARAPVVPSAWGLGVLFAASAMRRRRRESARR